MDIRISEKILSNFKDFWKACKNEEKLNIVTKGGRNSSKSTTVSIRLIYNRMKSRSHALVIRKIDKTLRRSCREQLIWAIKHLGVESKWKWSKAQQGEMTLTYKPTGASIFFEGANNPEKIKSYKTSDMPIVDIWFEELAEFKNEDEVTVITNSILRAELSDDVNYKFFFSYNPPKRKQNWTNKKYETQFIHKNTFIHHSTYLDNKFCSKEFIEEAENLKNTNIQKYKWIYLGEPIGGGVVPFENLNFRKITDEEYNSFDNIRQGIDWGYANDEFAFVRNHYDKTRRKLYFMNEIYEIKLSNRLAKDKIIDIYKKDANIYLQRNLNGETFNNFFKYKNNEHYNESESDYIERLIKYFMSIQIKADSSEPKSVNEMREYGLNCVGAKKGPGSVEYGEKWLDDLEEIVIDYERTPNTAKEFENIDYQVDKDGNIKNKLEDINNHCIDSCRYSLEDDMDEQQAIWF